MRYYLPTEERPETGVLVSDLILDNRPRVPEFTRAWVAAEQLVHEASHAFTPSHVECWFGSNLTGCDTDETGSWGMEAL